MRDLVKGATCFVRGFGLMTRPRLRRYAVAPFVVAVVVFAALIGVAIWQFTAVVDAMVAWLPGWLDWLEYLVWTLFAILVGGVLFFTYVLVVGLVAAPFNGLLAEATEHLLGGEPPPTTTFAKTMVRLPAMLVDEIAKVLYALLWGLPLLLLFLIPGLQLAAPFVWFLWCAWVTAFGFADYSMSAHGLKLRDIRRRLKRRRSLAIGFGAIAFGAMLVPVLNLFAVPAAVCGGAVLWVEEFRNESS